MLKTSLKKFEDFIAVDTVNMTAGKGKCWPFRPEWGGQDHHGADVDLCAATNSGTASVAGYDVDTHPKEVRSSVGVLTESHGLYHRMKADDYLAFFGHLYGMSGVSLDKKINPECWKKFAPHLVC